MSDTIISFVSIFVVVGVIAFNDYLSAGICCCYLTAIIIYFFEIETFDISMFKIDMRYMQHIAERLAIEIALQCAMPSNNIASNTCPCEI